MKSKSNDTALKAGIWYTISAIAVKAINIISTPIFTRLMTTPDYGLVHTYSSWFSLLSIFASLNLTYSIGRAKLDFPGDLEKYVGSMQMLSFLSSSIIAAIMMIFMNPLASFMGLNTNLLFLLAIHLIIYPIVPLWGSKFKYQYRYKENIATTAYVTVMTVVITLGIMVRLDSERYYAKVLGTIITLALLSAGFWIISIKDRYLSVNKVFWKYGLRISLPLILHSLSLSVLAQSDRIMITKFLGAEETGVYSLAYNYAILVNIVLWAVNDAWLPWFHDNLFADNKNEIKTKVKPLIVLGCFLGLGCIAVAPEAIYILGPIQYQAGKWVVGPVVLGVICQFIYQQYVHIELHEKQTKYISMGTMFAGAMNIVLNLIFIPIFGYIAAASTTMLSYFALMFIHLYITKCKLKVALYDDGFMVVALAVSVLGTAVYMGLYSTFLLRYVVLVFMCTVYALFNRKMILICLKRYKKEEER